MVRITRKMLENRMAELAVLCGKRTGPAWHKSADGKSHAVIGTWVLDGCPYQVGEIDNEHGGQSCPLGHHQHSARELCAILTGAIEAVRLVLGEDEFHARLRPLYSEGE